MTLHNCCCGRGFDSLRLHQFEENMKNYLVWYRLKGDDEDRIRGTARNWQRAERMAETLDLHLRASKQPIVAVGVKSGKHGELYHDETMHMRWSVVPPEEEK